MIYVSEGLCRFLLCCFSFICCFLVCYSYKFYCIRFFVAFLGFNLSSFPFFYNYPLEFFFCVVKASSIFSLVFFFPFFLWNLCSFFRSCWSEEELAYSLLGLYLYMFCFFILNFFSFLIILPLFWSFLRSFGFESTLGFVPELDMNIGYLVDFSFSYFIVFNAFLSFALAFLIFFICFGYFDKYSSISLKLNFFFSKRRFYLFIILLIFLFFNIAFFELFFFFFFFFK